MDDATPADAAPVVDGGGSEAPSSDDTGAEEQPGNPAVRALAPLGRFARRYDTTGIAVGLLFLALSMSPSLLPRASIVQGVLSGITLAVGYGLGTGIAKLWRYLELPEPSGSISRVVRLLVFLLLGLSLAYSSFNLVRWQNDLRAIFDMEPVSDGAYPMVVLMVAIVAAVTLTGLGRWVVRFVRASIGWFDRRVPRRASRVVGAVVAILLLWSFTSGVLLDGAVDVASRGFSVQNGRVDSSLAVPTQATRSGSPDSLIAWETLGSPGRTWIDRTPTAAEIDEFSGGGAIEPIRAYVGLESAGDSRARAELLLDELIRMGAFERSVLVLATSTGSGGIDPRGTSAVEYLHNGDTAIAGVQFSFLPSALSFFVDGGAAEDASTTTFEVIHGYWRDLDPDTRPEFYLFGVSLGSFASEQSATSIRTSGDPIDGAVWAGPTFNNTEWRSATDLRDDGSPAWLPVYDEGIVIRFTGGENTLDDLAGRWLEDRYVYIQHGSDPVSFFSPELLFSEPDWLRGERSPDVSMHMQWYPIVTFWQVAFDLPMGGSVPRGHGHNFGIPSYVDAWAAVTEPPGWSSADSERLTEHLVALDE